MQAAVYTGMRGHSFEQAAVQCNTQEISPYILNYSPHGKQGSQHSCDFQCGRRAIRINATSLSVWVVAAASIFVGPAVVPPAQMRT